MIGNFVYICVSKGSLPERIQLYTAIKSFVISKKSGPYYLVDENLTLASRLR